MRIALSNLYPDSNFFREAQKNDAFEVLAFIFDCLHRSFTSISSVSDAESEESNCSGSWDCAIRSCIAHTLFGMDIFERMNCGVESKHLKYTSFFHHINASALRTMKAMCADRSFDELLNLVEMNHQLACDTEAGGCGKLHYIHHILSSPPHVFTTVLGWQNTRESVDDLTATLKVLTTELDIGVLCHDLDPGNRHCLVSMVCYYGQHYHCFAYSHEHERWIMCDDVTVKVTGGWSDLQASAEKQKGQTVNDASAKKVMDMLKARPDLLQVIQAAAAAGGGGSGNSGVSTNKSIGSGVVGGNLKRGRTAHAAAEARKKAAARGLQVHPHGVPVLIPLSIRQTRSTAQLEEPQKETVGNAVKKEELKGYGSLVGDEVEHLVGLGATLNPKKQKAKPKGV